MRDVEFFLHKYAKQTMLLAFLKIPFADFRAKMIERHKELNERADIIEGVIVYDMQGSLAKKLDALLPLTVGGKSKILVCETRSSWCLYVENKLSGTEVYNQPNYFCQTWGPDVLSFTIVPPLRNVHLGSMQFEFKQRCPDGSLKVRNVAAHKESRWEFNEYGEPLPFEELEAYKARRIKDRLTPEMLERYAKHFGIDLFDPDFYEGRGAVISKKSFAIRYVDKYQNQ